MISSFVNGLRLVDYYYTLYAMFVRYVCSVNYLHVCMNQYTMITYMFILHNKVLGYRTPNLIIIFLNLATNAMEWVW